MDRLHHLRVVESAARELVLTSHHDRFGGCVVDAAALHRLTRTLMDARGDTRIAELAREIAGWPEGITAA